MDIMRQYYNESEYYVYKIQYNNAAIQYMGVALGVAILAEACARERDMTGCGCDLSDSL
jgi:hypothetical protein